MPMAAAVSHGPPRPFRVAPAFGYFVGSFVQGTSQQVVETKRY